MLSFNHQLCKDNMFYSRFPTVSQTVQDLGLLCLHFPVIEKRNADSSILFISFLLSDLCMVDQYLIHGLHYYKSN